MARKLDSAAPEAGVARPPLPLTSNQLVTLHLALHHPESTLAGHDALSPDPWAPYLRSLPRTFHWHHPLTWLVRLSAEDDEGEGAVGARLRKTEVLLESLFTCLPERAQLLVRDVERRFWADVEVLRSLLVRLSLLVSITSLAFAADVAPHLAQATSPPFPSCPTPPLRSLLWAWLNINTRCLTLHLGLGPADGSNDFTLAPIVDFANHSPSATPVPITLPEEASARKATQYALPATEDMVSSHAGGRKTEVLLQYGPHDDSFLFAEYGFVCWKDADGNGNRWNEARVDSLVEAMLMALPEGQGHAKKRILEDDGYWGWVFLPCSLRTPAMMTDVSRTSRSDFTLHLEPAPAHPSYRLLAALRLLHLPLSQVTAWRDVLLGYSPSISAANDEATVASLLELCDAVVATAREGREKVDEVVIQAGEVDEADAGEWAGALDSVRKLWEGQEDIAEGVRESVAEGVEF